jgi:hypothetical protein
LLLDCGLSESLEGKRVLAWIERDRGALQALGERLAIHHHLDRAHVISRRVFCLEHDGGDRSVDFVDVTAAFDPNVRRAARRGTHQKLLACGPQLVLVAQGDRAIAGGQAVGHRRVGCGGSALGNDQGQCAVRAAQAA